MSGVKFPYDACRRVHSRKQRRSKNGTPEERGTLREMVEEIDALIIPKIVCGINCLLYSRAAAGSLLTTAENGRLREERREIWRMADAATRYCRLLCRFMG
jgi:hypothetical protein